MKRRFADTLGNLALLIAVLAPLVVLLAAFASRSHLLDYRTAFDLVAVKIGGGVALAAAALALIALVLAFGDFKRLGMRALLAVLIAGVVLAGHVRFHLAARDAPPVHEVSTDWGDPVGFSDQLMASRGPSANPVESDPRVPASAGPPWGGARVAEVNAKTCPGAKPIMHGVDTDRVAKVLQDNGVQVLGSEVFRVEGAYVGFWFGAQDDIAVRIRPERTDIRSSRRVGLSDYGANCARVTRIIQALSR